MVCFQCIVDDFCHVRINTDSRYVIQIVILIIKLIHLFREFHDALLAVCTFQGRQIDAVKEEFLDLRSIVF